MKIPKKPGLPGRERVDMDLSTYLYDLENDPTQEHPLDAPEIEEKLIPKLRYLLEEIDSPAEQYQRLGIN